MIRGTKRPRVQAIELIEPKAQKIDAKLNASIHNRFDIEVVDAKTGEIKQRAQAENVICNALWTRLLTPQTYFNYIHYGTGSGTPAATDTSLFTFLNYGTPETANDLFNVDANAQYCSLRRKIQLSESTEVGSTLTEVGIGYSTTAASLCTHAMLKDMNGNPISIAKTSTDIINIYATVFVHFAVSGYSGIHILTRATANGDLRQYFLGYLLGVKENAGLAYSALVLGLKSLSGSSTHRMTNSTSYSAVNKTITVTQARIPVAMNTLASGIPGFVFCASFSAAYGSTPDRLLYPGIYLDAMANGWYAGSIITGEPIGTGDGSTVDFQTAFESVADATIYVDGVAVSATVDVGKRFLKNWSPFYFFEAVFAGKYNQPKCFATSEVSSRMNAGAGPYLQEYEAKIYFNPLFSQGVASFFVSGDFSLFLSDDLETWTALTSTTIPNELQHKKYWKFTNTAPSVYYIYTQSTSWPATVNDKNIHFDTPPAAGAAITADYTTKTIAKDASHVFDLTVTIQLGEYTE